MEWASKNMLVLGIIIAIGLLVHLQNFWYNMMFAELTGMSVAHSPADGFAFMQDTFSNPYLAGLYIIWFVAIWLHLTHGFWSSLQTTIGFIYVTLLMLGFLVVVLAFAFGCAPSLCDGNCCSLCC